MGGEAIFFTGRGGVGRGKAKNLRDGAVRGTPPSPQCGAGRGRGQNLWGEERPGRGTYCMYQLIEIIIAAKEILICIALSEVNLLNIHNIDRNHN